MLTANEEGIERGLLVPRSLNYTVAKGTRACGHTQPGASIFVGTFRDIMQYPALTLTLILTSTFKKSLNPHTGHEHKSSLPKHILTFLVE